MGYNYKKNTNDSLEMRERDERNVRLLDAIA